MVDQTLSRDCPRLAAFQRFAQHAGDDGGFFLWCFSFDQGQALGGLFRQGEFGIACTLMVENEDMHVLTVTEGNAYYGCNGGATDEDLTVAGKAGRVLIFEHSALHEGCRIENGTKVRALSRGCYLGARRHAVQDARADRSADAFHRARHRWSFERT